MIFVISSLFSFFASFFVPTTYYVTPAATGSGTGLDSSNTLSYAALYGKTLASGDIVKFKAGNTFFGQHYPKDGVTYDRYSSGSNPVISGYTTLSSWALSSGNIYYATLSYSQLRAVSIDGVIKAPGRYPNSGYLLYTSHSGNTSITGTSIGTLPSSFIGGEVVIKKYRYITDRHIITGKSGNTITYSSTNFYGNNNLYSPTDPQQAGYLGDGYFIQNHIAALDQDGEWSYDASTSRLYVYFSGTPAGRVVKAATVNDLVICNSTVNATFKNLDIEGGNNGITNNGINNITITNCNIRQCGVGVYGSVVENLKVQNSNIADCWSNGILVEAASLTDDHNMLVDNVTLNNIGTIPGMGQSGDGRNNAIGLYGNKITATNNTVKNVGFCGISFIGDSVLVEHNYIDTFCTLKDDAGGIYTVSSSGTTSVSRIIRNNIILNAIGSPDGAQYNGDPSGEAAAIYLDDYSNHTEVSGNTGAHGPWGGIFINSNGDNQILNNTMFDFRQQMLVAEHIVGAVRNLTITGNKFIARTTSQRCLWVTFNNGISDNPVNLGNWNNNYYSRPIDDSLTITLFRPNEAFYQDMTLSAWKSTYLQDAASSKSSVTTTSLSNLSFVYNATLSSANVTLTGIYKDVLNVPFSGLINLPAYSGSVLIYNSALPSGFFIIRAGSFKFSNQ